MTEDPKYQIIGHEPPTKEELRRLGIKDGEQQEWNSLRGRVKHVPGGKMSR